MVEAFNDAVLTRQSAIPLKFNRREAKWIGHIWLRNWLLNDVKEGNKDGSDEKTRKKTSAATGQPQGKE